MAKSSKKRAAQAPVQILLVRTGEPVRMRAGLASVVSRDDRVLRVASELLAARFTKVNPGWVRNRRQVMEECLAWARQLVALSDKGLPKPVRVRGARR